MDAAFAQLSEQLEHTLQEQRTDMTRRLQAMEGTLLNHRTSSEPLAASPRQAPPPGRGSRNVSQNGGGGGRLLWAGGRHLVGPPPADQQALSASDGGGGHF